MKYWLSHLPLEVWVDVFRYPWISRKELGRIVDRFGNRKFAEYLQFYLHDWGKHTLHDLGFEEDGLLYNYIDYKKYLVDIPLAPMPENIKAFNSITIWFVKFIKKNENCSHFDAQTIHFLRQIQPLLTNVKFLEMFGYGPDNFGDLRTILAPMAPLLGGIQALSCDVFALSTVELCFGNRKLAKLKQLSILYGERGNMGQALTETTVNFLMHWLSTADNNGPKLCMANIMDDNAFYEQISAAIRQQFFAAKTPCTFALKILLHCPAQIAEFHLENRIGEELHGVPISGAHFQITRHQPNCGTKLQEWAKSGEGQGQIEILKPTIGSFDADATMGMPRDGEEERQQPSTSKKV